MIQIISDGNGKFFLYPFQSKNSSKERSFVEIERSVSAASLHMFYYYCLIVISEVALLG